MRMFTVLFIFLISLMIISCNNTKAAKEKPKAVLKIETKKYPSGSMYYTYHLDTTKRKEIWVENNSYRTLYFDTNGVNFYFSGRMEDKKSNKYNHFYEINDAKPREISNNFWVTDLIRVDSEFYYKSKALKDVNISFSNYIVEYYYDKKGRGIGKRFYCFGDDYKYFLDGNECYKISRSVSREYAECLSCSKTEMGEFVRRAQIVYADVLNRIMTNPRFRQFIDEGPVLDYKKLENLIN